MRVWNDLFRVVVVARRWPTCNNVCNSSRVDPPTLSNVYELAEAWQKYGAVGPLPRLCG